ncbi:MAG TPA: ABC transporter ATP-binding protein [Candidatus Dormibacteraeota bacterium]|nr:ABC transporter ATP-binding protein [Candidatus Dormibacteraeota bacterium]
MVVGSELLRVEQLRTHFMTNDGAVRAVDGVDLTVTRGRTLGVVGESGCGKSVTALTILRLLSRTARVVGGRILFGDQDLVKVPEYVMRRIRGGEISMIFQEPMTSLNPVFTVGYQVREAINEHLGLPDKEAHERVIEFFKLVGIPAPERRVHDYPHQLSGGMRQRVMIAMALSCSPKLLIADEPTTALDVTIQAQILELMSELRERHDMGIMLITHDLGVIAEMADEVVVMYAGKVVERGTVEQIFDDPQHPYTQGLLASIPGRKTRGQRLSAIKGTVPHPLNRPPGCTFTPRCPRAFERCPTAFPALMDHGTTGHEVACYLYGDEAEASREPATATDRAPVSA